MNPKYTINYFINAGTHNLDENEKRLVIMVNIMAFVPALMAFTLGPVLYFYSRSPILLYCPIIEGFVFLTIPWLNGTGRYIAARAVMFSTHSLSTLFFGIVLGQVANVEIITIFLMWLLFLLFPTGKQRVAGVLLVLSILGFLQLNYEYQFAEPLPFFSTAIKIPRLLVLFAVTLLNLLVFYFCSTHFNLWINKLQKYNRGLEKKTLQLEEANRHKSEFIRDTSHEIRNPLNVVYRISQEMLSGIEKNSGSSEVSIPVQHAKALHSASENIMNVINNVLDWSSIENGRLKTETAPFEWQTCINKITSTYQVLADIQGVTILQETDAKLPPIIISDEKILTKILSNLLSNAIKFTAEGSEVRVQVLFDQGKQFAIKVKDQGPGLDPVQQELIFLPYVSERHKRFEGTGLGLPLVKEMAEALGGCVKIESAKGQGSTFIVSLPLETTTVNNKAFIAPRPQPVYEKFNNCIVLVIEDDRINQLALGMLLKRTGCVALFATDVLTGIEIAKKQRPNLIIMDVNLPGFSGEEALGMVRANNVLRATPIITVTGDCFTDTQQRMLEAGSNGFLTKPVQFDAFYTQLKSLLAQS